MHKLMFLFLVVSSFLVNTANSSTYTNIYWGNKAVNVCFADEGSAKGPNYTKWKDEQKKKVQMIVEKEYSKERTGVHFIGFEDCNNSSYKPNIIIYLIKNSKLKLALMGGVRGSSTVGKTLYYVDTKYPGAAGKILLTTAGLSYSTIVHEFGHSAGLHHEHEHYDAHELDRCSDTSNKNKKIFGRNYTEYDPESVMNYCMIKKRYKDVGLSAGDIEALQIMYRDRK